MKKQIIKNMLFWVLPVLIEMKFFREIIFRKARIKKKQKIIIFKPFS